MRTEMGANLNGRLLQCNLVVNCSMATRNWGRDICQSSCSKGINLVSGLH